MNWQRFWRVKSSMRGGPLCSLAGDAPVPWGANSPVGRFQSTNPLGSRNRTRRQVDLKPLAHGPENGRKLVHTGIAFGRKHPVQTIDCAVLAMSHEP